MNAFKVQNNIGKLPIYLAIYHKPTPLPHVMKLLFDAYPKAVTTGNQPKVAKGLKQEPLKAIFCFKQAPADNNGSEYLHQLHCDIIGIFFCATCEDFT
jgi:hypothetical protein